MTPSFMGRMATMSPGVLPSIRFASWPTARTFPVLVWTATTEGSERTIPCPFTWTRVLAVPRSMPISFENIPYSESKTMYILLWLIAKKFFPF